MITIKNIINFILALILKYIFSQPREFWSIDTLPQLNVFDNTCINNVCDELDKHNLGWKSWPERRLHNGGWTIIPLFAFHTWLPASEHMIYTSRILHNIHGLRTALFSRMEPGVRLTPHYGYSFLANNVLRCHIVLKCDNNTCYVEVNGKKRYVSLEDKIIFDDSLLHSAGNEGSQDRIVLILDIDRPLHVPRGTAVKGKTVELAEIAREFGITLS